MLESTTYPGTTNDIVRPLLEALRSGIAGVDFFLAYSPERVDPGNPDLRHHEEHAQGRRRLRSHARRSSSVELYGRTVHRDGRAL